MSKAKCTFCASTQVKIIIHAFFLVSRQRGRGSLVRFMRLQFERLLSLEFLPLLKYHGQCNSYLVIPSAILFVLEYFQFFPKYIAILSS